MENKIEVGGVEYDSMGMDCLQWKNVTFWGLSISGDNEYSKFEVYDEKHGLEYKLIMSNPYEGRHSSGWNIYVTRFGDIKHCQKITDLPIFNKAKFQELFASIAVLINENYDPFTTDMDLLKNMKKTWKKWSKELPLYLNATIEETEEMKLYES
jgi:hypothetical protein